MTKPDNIVRYLGQQEAQEFVSLLAGEWRAYRDPLSALAEWPRGIEIHIKPIPKRQTDSQRGFYWTHVKGLAAELGDTWEGLHDDLMLECGYFVEVQTPRGARKRRWSSTQLDRDEYSALIDRLMQVCELVQFSLPPLPADYRNTTGET